MVRGFLKSVKTYLSYRTSIAVLLAKQQYHRRTSQYTNTGKIALCCIAKMENEYIRFFVEYYKSLHFDKILLYDNNDPDGEHFEEIINDYIQSGFVEVIDYRGRKVAQLSAYQDCYDKYNKQFDWIAFFDCDEFLTFADGTIDIHTFLNPIRFKHFQIVHVNWMVYGDNDQLDNDGRSIIDRLRCPVLPYDFKPVGSLMPENNHIKSIIRGGLSVVRWNQALNPHTPQSEYYLCCNPEGKEVDVNSPFADYNYNVAFLRHYSTKTIGEWVKNKMKRGIPDRSMEKWDDVLNIDFFFRFNQRTNEKITYAQKLLQEQ